MYIVRLCFTDSVTLLVEVLLPNICDSFQVVKIFGEILRSFAAKAAFFFFQNKKIKRIELQQQQRMNYFTITTIQFVIYFQILLFPEGTDLTAGSQQRSHQFASTHKLERYYQVLHPKTTGFVFLARRMRQSE
jgi:hypothetical protein